MAPRICMNTSCGTETTVQWKKGWQLRSGEISDLCFKCGSAYESLVYCDTFHSEESGWRECSLCNKRLHCGCSASVLLIEIQDFGGVWCISCAQNAVCLSVQKDRIPHEARPVGTCAVDDLENIQANNKLRGDTLDNGNLLSLGNIVKANERKHLSQPQARHANGSSGHIKRGVKHTMRVAGTGFPNLSQSPNASPKFSKPNENKKNTGVKDLQEPQFQPSLNISLCAPSEIPDIDLALPGGVDEVEKCKLPLFQPAPRPRHILPKPSKNNLAKVTETNKGLVSHMRFARPPVEGRLRNQLLPRYWPRITDQELQQISGDLNSTIVPLFEKVLSASDASRIGRLVLPKACAETYFPPINQSEGLPLKIQDVKGNEWTFQFRFWPNNNSRMYVLEGVTHCIQSMQLQAGDTVTFSRIDPGGKLVIGFRKASNAVEPQDPQTSGPSNVTASGESLYSDVTDSLSTIKGYSGFLQSLKGSKDNCLNALSEQSNLVNGDTDLNTSERPEGRMHEDILQQLVLSSDKKSTRNISSKSKRLLMHTEDALELKLTWEETQDLLRPPPSVQPNIIMIEDFEFEEYNEPPVFGKRTLFTTRIPGGREQWARCDKCAKWRKLLVDVLLPPKWTCSDNVWDRSRSSCCAPDEMSSKELDKLFRANNDIKKRKASKSPELGQGCEPWGLDALATAATLGEQVHDPDLELEEPPTTRHPRHRPGCTCIVCIQPPSGKGKHKPTCVCNVCSTVKRRFKTLMMRKKKRQCEREEEMAQQQRKHYDPSTEEEQEEEEEYPPNNDCMPNKDSQIKTLSVESSGNGKTRIDLNCHPSRGDDVQSEGPSCVSMTSLVQAASLPLEMYMKQNGFASLDYEKDSSFHLLQQANGIQNQGCQEEQHSESIVGEQQGGDAHKVSSSPLRE
ncbi:hypothetical protein Nepgr_009288 [Nepenthes gracilis]|uniref:Uncharacterized protein n=1 Tax=Nepenthes gracilis TaxID=150966 RepID=A0AAD3SAC6_NEPGR|nr:hypothetical protein Nepgr_009288 [Nepenthes gracilis]